MTTSACPQYGHQVPVLDQRHRRLLRAANVVAVGIDVRRKIHEVLVGAGNLACPHPRAGARSPETPPMR